MTLSYLALTIFVNTIILTVAIVLSMLLYNLINNAMCFTSDIVERIATFFTKAKKSNVCTFKVSATLLANGYIAIC
jgi:hypothetical protein